MMNKLKDGYRIPVISEFINGFEFEVYSEGYSEENIEDFCGWYEYKFGFDNWRSLDEIQWELKQNNIQVKI